MMKGQFTDPSEVPVNAQNDIIVVDTSNHLIQIFDKEGRFKFQFGECEKRDGHLLYPNHVAVVRTSGDILQHPRGVTVENKGCEIFVECRLCMSSSLINL